MEKWNIDYRVEYGVGTSGIGKVERSMEMKLVSKGK